MQGVGKPRTLTNYSLDFSVSSLSSLAAYDTFEYQSQCLLSDTNQCINATAGAYVSACGLSCAMQQFVDETMMLIGHTHDMQLWNNTHIGSIAKLELHDLANGLFQALTMQQTDHGASIDTGVRTMAGLLAASCLVFIVLFGG